MWSGQLFGVILFYVSNNNKVCATIGLGGGTALSYCLVNIWYHYTYVKMNVYIANV